jgi:hypothetical protein
MCRFRSAIPLFALLASFVLAGENHHAVAQERLALKGVKVQSLAFSPDGKVLALGCWDGTIVLVDPATGKEQGRHRGTIESGQRDRRECLLRLQGAGGICLLRIKFCTDRTPGGD